MKDPYEILGIQRDATDDEIKDAYRALVRKYHPDNYTDDNPLKELATEKMQAVNEAYDAVMRERATGSKGGNAYDAKNAYNTGSATGVPPVYLEIRDLLNRRRVGEAERRLEEIPVGERIGEWHYLMSIVLFKRGRVNDAMRELELACEAEPNNFEYQQAKQMFNSGAGGYGSTYYGADNPTRGTTGTSSDICDTCMHLALCDCICECLGGDLIPCL